MSVAATCLTHLVSLLEGQASPAPHRGIDTDRFRHVELDQELTYAAGTGRPYPLGLSDIRKYQPLDTPSTVSGDHVWRGQEFDLWVSYSYDDHDRLARHQEVLDDEMMIHRCLSDPCSWLAVEGVGVVDVDRGEIRDLTEDRIFLLLITIRMALREDYT